MCIEFSKMHGTGNDYIYINIFRQKVSNPEKFAIWASNRYFGIGSDGVILIAPSRVADCRMIMYNADGTSGSMCGNGIRCVAKYLYDKDITKNESILIETASGIKKVNLLIENKKVSEVSVDMGRPVMEQNELKLEINETEYLVNCVSTGNLHAVVFSDNIDNFDLLTLGPKFEHHELFPDRINTEFVNIIDSRSIKMRVWERGSGETNSCGTGSCASVYAAVQRGLLAKEEEVKVYLKGGVLKITCMSDDRIIMKGPATHVYDGVVDIEGLGL